MENPIFYNVTTGGPHTNLQLHSLRLALREWKSIEQRKEYLEHNRGQMIQCGAAVVALLGLSVSQLLGHNVPQSGEKVDDPKCMVKALLDRAGFTDASARKILESSIEELLLLCEDIRHAGRTPKGTKHLSLATLTFERTAELVDSTLRLWNVVIAAHKQQPANDLEEFDTIEDAIAELNRYDGYCIEDDENGAE